MAKKRHHMTKHQYNAYKKNHRQYKHALDIEEEKISYGRSQYSKYRKKSDEKLRRQLRNIQEHSNDLSDEEEYMA